MNSMNYIKIAQDSLKITKNKKYSIGTTEVKLPDIDYENVIAFSPEDGASLLVDNETTINTMKEQGDSNCKIVITSEDSFQAASRYTNALVMNFANAHCPGGGFLMGATAQEEALCRCSTLYASITSSEAGAMYKYNNTHINSVESDYMLLSPNVCVFRDARCELLEKPFVTGVITLPAPNRIGAAMFTPVKKISEAMTRRIRIMLLIAKEYGYKDIVLGAWGCGAFHNDPMEVAGCFKKVIIEEGYGMFFDEICFAIYGKEDGKNIIEFRKCFQK